MKVVPFLASLAAIAAFGALWSYGVIGGAATAPGPVVTPPPGVAPGSIRRVLFLGTSLTSRGDWVERLRQRLDGCAEGIVFDRAAKPGGTSRFGAAALADAGPERLASYDLVVMEFSGNDASVVHGFPLFRSRSVHERLIETVRAAGPHVILATMSPGYGWKALARPGQDRYHALYRDLARERDVGLIDTVEAWRALAPADRREMMPDDLHPTEKGMAIVTVPPFDAALRPLVCG